MKFALRFLVFFVFFGLSFLHFRDSVKASNEFLTSYDIVYEVTLEGKVKVSQEVSLTNKFSNIYATEYSVTLGKGRLSDIAAFDNQGPLEVATQTEGEKTIMTLHFNDQVVGKNKTLKFNLSYEFSELFHRYGEVYEVNLPKIVNPEAIDNYAVTLRVPLGFGKPAFISPGPKNQKTDSQWQIFFFEKNQLVASGVVAVFGKFQVFDFILNYHLSNPQSEETLKKIALPPDTGYQKISYKKIEPSPLNIEIDNDGNWLALYQLKKEEKLNVKAYGQAKIFAQPQAEFEEIFKSKFNLNRYLQSQKFWEADEPQIKSLAQTLKTPKQIHDFVVGKLEYDYSRVREGAKRFGAAKALQEPQRAICMEYTDLFIALARAAGIPARELNGFAYTDNPLLQPLSLVQDVLHSWPEYWDEKKGVWVQIDPTWEDTTGGVDYFSKLDLGHFVFVIHGQNSERPLTAGSYKEPGQSKKDVEISFGRYEETGPDNLEISFLFPKKAVSERGIEGKIRLSNKGQNAFYNLELQITTENLKLLTPGFSTLAVLPPFSWQEIPVLLTATNKFSSGTGKIIVFGNKQRFEYNLEYESLILGKIIPLFSLLLFLALIIYLARKFWLLPKETKIK